MGAGVIWNIATPLHSSVTPFTQSGRFPNVRVNVDGGLSGACFNHESPNFQPTGIATLAGGQLAPIQPPNDGFFEAVTLRLARCRRRPPTTGRTAGHRTAAMIVRGAAVAVGAALAIACGAVGPSPLVNTQISTVALAEAVLRGFERRDLPALMALSVTEAEFQVHIWPELPASRPERNLPFSYIWGHLRQKSESSLSQSVARYGGRALALLRVE